MKQLDYFLLSVIGGVFIFIVIPLLRAWMIESKKRLSTIENRFTDLEVKVDKKFLHFERKFQDNFQNKLHENKDLIQNNNIKTLSEINKLSLLIVDLRTKMDILLNSNKN